MAPGSGFNADRVPALSLAEAAEVEDALAVYRAAPSGSTPRQVNKMMTKLALGFPNQRLSDAEAAARLELYGEQLGDIALDVLGAGFAAAVRSCRFFPSVSELRQLALSQPATPRMVREFRLKLLLAEHRKAPPPVDDPFDVTAANAEMEERGLRMRFRADGTVYQLPIEAPLDQREAA